MIAGLAHKIAQKKVPDMGKVEMLRSLASQEFVMAAEEDRVKTPMRIVPDLGLNRSGGY